MIENNPKALAALGLFYISKNFEAALKRFLFLRFPLPSGHGFADSPSAFFSKWVDIVNIYVYNEYIQ